RRPYIDRPIGVTEDAPDQVFRRTGDVGTESAQILCPRRRAGHRWRRPPDGGDRDRWLSPSGPRSAARELGAVLELRLQVVAVHQRDEVDGDRLRARGLALAVVGAGTEEVLHGVDHG